MKDLERTHKAGWQGEAHRHWRVKVRGPDTGEPLRLTCSPHRRTGEDTCDEAENVVNRPILLPVIALCGNGVGREGRQTAGCMVSVVQWHRGEDRKPQEFQVGTTLGPKQGPVEPETVTSQTVG